MNRLTTHLRRNVVAYIALFVALGGTSYAAVSVRDHSLVPQKFNPTYVGGYVRAWVSVSGNGHVIASGGKFRLRAQPDAGPGHYAVDWRPNPGSRCTTFGNVSIFAGPKPGYMVTNAARLPDGRVQSAVQTYNASGGQAALPFSLVLVCATPH
jgi:hypothetical protein